MSDSKTIHSDIYYKNILIKHDPNMTELLKGYDIIKKYIIREKLLLTGGMAIDFALRLHKKKLYDDDAIPDYDFVSHRHWIDAYEIAQWMTRINIKNITVINALHPTTMKVRINFIGVADITYNPKNIIEKTPKLNYHGFDFVHPHYQFIDQHSSLSMGYEKLEMGLPVAPDRWKKDMTRYDLLWNDYPLKWNGSIKNIELCDEKKIPFGAIKNQCLTGFVALIYWIKFAKKKKFETKYIFGKFDLVGSHIIYTVPIGSSITIYSNNIFETLNAIKEECGVEKEYFYNKFLDKIPRKVILDDAFEILDNKNIWIAAHKENNFYVANLQPIMMYFLTNYIFWDELHSHACKKYTYYAGYMAARELLKFGVESGVDELLPTSEYYGIDNCSESYILAKLKFENKRNIQEKKMLPAQPAHVYDKDLKYKKVPDAYYKFNPSDSELFRMDGRQCDRFI